MRRDWGALLGTVRRRLSPGLPGTRRLGVRSEAMASASSLK
jgi:hypothetical protein